MSLPARITSQEADLLTVVDGRRALTRWYMAGPDPHELPDLASLLRRPAWMAEAACREMGVDTFVHGRTGNPRTPKAVCAGCPVREPCLAFAMADSDLEGVWGGTSTRERRAMRGHFDEGYRWWPAVTAPKSRQPAVGRSLDPQIRIGRPTGSSVLTGCPHLRGQADPGVAYPRVSED